MIHLLPSDSSSEHAGDMSALATRWRTTLHASAARRSKLFALAFRLAAPPGTLLGAGPLRLFLDAFHASLAARNLDPVLLAAPGRGASGCLVLVLLNGQRTQSAHGHIAAARGLWSRMPRTAVANVSVVPCLYPDGSTGAKIRRDAVSWGTDLAECLDWGCRLLAEARSSP
jgi:hypothetical protein